MKNRQGVLISLPITDFTFGNQKINFHTGISICSGGVGVKIKFMSIGCKHLSNNVFYDHSFIHF